MAQKYRCPVCGATHKELQPQCRLCGQALGPEAVVGTPAETKVILEERKGIGAIVAVVILLVVVIVAVAVLLNVVPGSKAVETAKNKVGLDPVADGWSAFDDPEAGFSVQFPEGDRKTAIDPDGTYKAYTLINKDTLLLVTAREVMTKEEFDSFVHTTDPDNTLKRQLRMLADKHQTDVEAASGKIEKRTDADAYGLPAEYYEYRDGKPAIEGLRTDAPLHTRQLLFVKDGILYTITVTSVYKDAEQFDRVLNTLAITAPPGQPASTTTTAAVP